jgi:hypothetical protein
MNGSQQQQHGKAGYERILAESPRDAWLFLWSVRIVTVAGFVTFYIFLFAVLWPLIGLLRGTWMGTGGYVFRIVVWPVPSLVLLLVAASLNRKIARKYGFAKE